MSPSLTDWIGSSNASGFITVRTGLYVRLVDQITGGAYVSSSPTDANGAWTISSRPPAGNYEVYTGPSGSGPWTDTGYVYEVTPWAVPWVNVTDYVGVDPTGVADSTTGLQSVLTAAAGGTVYVPAGTYLFTYLTLSANTTLVGPGTLKVKNAANTAGYVISVASGCRLRDLTIDGNQANQTSGVASAMAAISVSNCQFLNLTIQNSYDRGLYLYGVTDGLVDGCRFLNCGKTNADDGSASALAVWNSSVRVRMVNNRIDSPKGCGITCDGLTNGVIANNVVYSPYSIGIGLGNGSSGALIANNRVIVTSTHVNGGLSWPNCIDIGNGTDIVVQGNYCSGGGGGIGNAPPSYRTIISANVVESCTNGIYMGGLLNTSVDMLVTGNTVRGCASYGITVPYLISGVISNNISKNNGTNTGLTTDNRSGILVYGDGTGGYCSDLVIQGNRCGDDKGTKTQTYGIYVEGASNTSLLISNNDLRGNLTSTVFNASGSGVILRHNLGLNPVGSQTPPSVPASGAAAVTNPFSYDCTVYVTNAATTGPGAITIGGTSTGITLSTTLTRMAFRVPAGSSIGLGTYTGAAPTWTWFAD